MTFRRFYVTGFGVLMLFDTLTQVSFKLATSHAGEFGLRLTWLSEVFAHPWVYGAVIGYLGAFVTWMTLLKHAPVGPAFAASHLEIVSVLLVSVWVFGEHVTLMQILGGLSILLGIWCLGMSDSGHSQT